MIEEHAMQCLFDGVEVASRACEILRVDIVLDMVLGSHERV